jgi:transposase InsO family protein
MPQSQMLKEQVEAIGETSLDASAPVTKAPEYGGHTTQRTAVIIGPILADGVLAPNRFNEHWFLSLAHARRIVEDWRLDYNRDRPHSSLRNLTPEEFRQVYTKRLEPAGL